MRSILICLILVVLTGCSGERIKNEAKEAGSRYWLEKAYPGKAYNVQVVDAEESDGGTYKVKGVVDGETRFGTYSPKTGNFSEGYYALAHERERHIAEVEQENRYLKDRVDALEKENYKLKVRLDTGQEKPSNGATISKAPAM